jgi:hypothetical protein
MIVRWTAGALADLTSIENYQRRHWPESRAAFDRDRASISELPQSAPEVTQRSAFVWSRSSISPIGFSTALTPTQSLFGRFGTHRVSPYLDEGHDRCRTRKGLQKLADRLALEAV